MEWFIVIQMTQGKIKFNCFQKVWNLFRNSERVKEMVVKRIQEESLRTYLLMHSTVYTTVSLDNLAKLFDLDKKQAHSIIR